ncbi:putative histidinol-phosphatase [Lachnellula occidentalis]|uniref:Histidinol-phosphatase n=1 Tax=Lachnellula occidentalis TaxID=215460 RepID=A0A8H8RV23_9HELO|nr:putative histidinol-phosphatase [Lachnellula occidentalis]
MAFSMHSHSGQFCPGHAKDSLEDIILTAIAKGMQTFALTEHMPRNSEEDLYPEEIAAGKTIDPTFSNHNAYITEALRLRAKYTSQLHILIGFEGEWIRPSYGPLITSLSSNPAIDFVLGSVHHVHGHPIDYDAALYAKAVSASGGSEELCFDAYFESQYAMLLALKPRVVAHFDLIRLLCAKPNLCLRTLKGVWEKVVRNLRVVVEQGGLLEINSAGLRKGLEEPYPGRAVCEAFRGMGGRFTLSDDSHGIEHVGTNYGRAFEYLEGLGVEELWTFERVGEELRLKSVRLVDVKATFKE